LAISRGGTGFIVAGSGGKVVVTHSITMFDTVVDTQNLLG